MKFDEQLTAEICKNKYFVFMDESGNNTKDRFFVLGILMVKAEEISELFNFLENISSKIRNRSRENMIKRVDKEYQNENIEKIISMAKSFRSFEMKFKAINKENEDFYIHILHKYFNFSNARFCALVFDKKDSNIDFQPDGMSHWNRYINNAAMLIANNVEKLLKAEFMIFADQITQPSGGCNYENTLLRKIKERLIKKQRNSKCIWGAIRIESHASVFLQLVDIFVGAIAYDFQGQDKVRKIEFMKILRNKLNIDRKIQSSITKMSPNYFSVWKYQSRYK